MEYVLIIIYANEWTNAICRWPNTTYKQPCMKWNLLKITRTTSRYVGIPLILLQPQHPPFKPKRFHHHIDKSLLFHVQDRGIFFINSRVWISFAFMNTFTMFSSRGLLSKCFVHWGSPVADQPPPYNQPPHPPIRTPVSSSSSSSSSNQKRSLNITSFIHNRQDFARPWELW